MTSHSPSIYTAARVTIILHQLGWGGVERVASILANRFAEQGVQTELLVCARGGPGEEVLKGIIGENVKLCFFRQASGHRVMDLFLAFVKMGRHLQSNKPDIVLSAGNNVSLFTMLITRLFCPWKTSLIIKTTNPVLRPNDSRHKRLLRRLCYAFIFRFSDGVLPLTESESAHLEESFPGLKDKVVTVNNPYIADDALPTHLIKLRKIKTKPRLVIAAGRLHKQKRFDVLLHAFTRVSKMMDCRLVILGDGEDRERLAELSISLGIAHLVKMPGYVSNVQPWFLRSDLFVLSSDYEGLPAVVLEALAHNCPVVATDCFQGARQLLQGAPKCEIAPMRNPELLADAIIKSLDALCSTSALYELADKYRFETAVDSHLTAINQLIYQEQIPAYKLQKTIRAENIQ